jgi:predicted ATPase/DNA-binding CsgD family transcriptional regulator
MPVPAARSSFVGRTAELTRLRALLARERLVTVVGPGGIGKTRLATEALRAEPPSRLHGFVELGSAGPLADPADAVLAGCGFREDPGRSARDVLRERLGAGLLVLDCCEHVRDEVAELVGELTTACAQLRVLATSRAALGLAGEVVVPLTGLGPAAPKLLVERARAVQPALPAGPGTDAVADDICRLADGVPLAIELAAAHARSLPLSAVRDGMADRMRFLARGGGAGRHSSLRSSLDWSAQIVGPTARAALGALSVLDGWFPLDAAIAVTGDIAALESLVDHSLVQFDAPGERYLVLDTVREYAAATVDAAVVEAARDRLLDWAATFARESRGGLERADPGVLSRVARADAAVRSALVPDPRAADVVADLAFGWSLRGRLREGVAAAERVVDATAPSRLRWAHAFLTLYSGDVERGYELAATASADTDVGGASRARLLILTGMAQAFVDPAGAEPALLEAQQLARAAGDTWAEVEAGQIVAYTHLYRGAYTAAVQSADGVTDALAELGHGQLRAWDGAIRAEAAAARAEYPDAVRHGRSALTLAMDVGEPVSAAGAWTPLLKALVATGEQDAAEATLAEGLAFLREHPGLGSAECAALANAIVAAHGDAATAASAAGRAVAAGATLPIAAAEAGLLLATARLRLGDGPGARAAADAAVEVADQLGHQVFAAAGLLVRAAALGEAGAAHEALAAAYGLGAVPLVLDALDVVAHLARSAGRERVAARLHGSVRRQRAELGTVVSPLASMFAPEPGFGGEAGQEGERLGLAGAVGYAQRSRGRRDRPRAGWHSLTPAERAVVELVARGRSNAQIATELLVSTGTVRTHLRSVFAKLDVTNRTELAAQASSQDL